MVHEYVYSVRSTDSLRETEPYWPTSRVAPVVLLYHMSDDSANVLDYFDTLYYANNYSGVTNQTQCVNPFSIMVR